MPVTKNDHLLAVWVPDELFGQLKRLANTETTASYVRTMLAKHVKKKQKKEESR